MINNFKGFYLVIFAVLALIFYISAIYFNFFETNPPLTREEWGQLGDYFGGTLNPILGFASFLALLATIVYQVKELNLSRTELELTREELSRSATALASQNKAIELQSFEQTFFSWLNTYRDLLNSISGGHDVQNATGRKQLYNWWIARVSSNSIYSTLCEYDVNTASMRLTNDFSGNYGQNFETLSNYKKIEIIAEHRPDNLTNHILKLWALLYHDNEYQLDGLFRVIYRLILWIDSQDSKRVSLAQKWLYVSIIRSQFSRIEMIFLFYNGLTGVGEKFKPLIEKYALFDNLTFDSDIGIKAIKKHFSSQNFYFDSAFSSELAREKLGLPKSSEETLALATTTSQV